MQTTDESLQFRKLCLETEFFFAVGKSRPKRIVHSHTVIDRHGDQVIVETSEGVQRWRNIQFTKPYVECESSRVSEEMSEKQEEERCPNRCAKRPERFGAFVVDVK